MISKESLDTAAGKSGGRRNFINAHTNIPPREYFPLKGLIDFGDFGGCSRFVSHDALNSERRCRRQSA
jgi:hypothetical protein